MKTTINSETFDVANLMELLDNLYPAEPEKVCTEKVHTQKEIKYYYNNMIRTTFSYHKQVKSNLDIVYEHLLLFSNFISNIENRSIFLNELTLIGIMPSYRNKKT